MVENGRYNASKKPVLVRWANPCNRGEWITFATGTHDQVVYHKPPWFPFSIIESCQSLVVSSAAFTTCREPLCVSPSENHNGQCQHCYRCWSWLTMTKPLKHRDFDPYTDDTDCRPEPLWTIGIHGPLANIDNWKQNKPVSSVYDVHERSPKWSGFTASIRVKENRVEYLSHFVCSENDARTKPSKILLFLFIPFGGTNIEKSVTKPFNNHHQILIFLTPQIINCTDNLVPTGHFYNNNFWPLTNFRFKYRTPANHYRPHWLTI